MSNGAQALIRTLVDARNRHLLHESRAPRRSTSSPRWTRCRRCARSWPCSRASPRARPTDTPGCPGAPAATLLHLGPGLGYGLANLHNARRAKVPVVSIVGDHATYHTQYDAQLQSDIETVARNVSDWVRTSQSTARAGRRRGPRRSPPRIGPAGSGRHADPAGRRVLERRRRARGTPAGRRPRPVGLGQKPSRRWRGRSGAAIGRALLLGGRARAGGLMAAGRIASATGAKLLGETFPARLERGAGLPAWSGSRTGPELAAGAARRTEAPGAGRRARLPWRSLPTRARKS